MEKSEEHNSLCGDATGEGSKTTARLDQVTAATLASMATAMAGLMEPTEAEALNDAAAKLMEGGDDGNA